MIGAGVDEIKEASAAIELGEKDSDIGLSFRASDPLQARLDAAVFTAAFAEDPASIAAHTHRVSNSNQIDQKMEISRSACLYE